MKIKIMLLLAMLLVSGLVAVTYYVPSDFSTIQIGINYMGNNDILLVSPGIYYENIDFQSKRITVASLYYTTQDTSYISQTIIDGNNNGRVVAITDVSGGHPVLSGFTLQNGRSGGGAGIYCSHSQAILSHLIIKDNIATGTMAIDTGGGIYCGNSSPTLSDLLIENNSGERCGGLFCIDSHPELNNVNFIGNISDSSGGGVYGYNGTIEISNGCFIGNSAVEGGGLYNFNSNTYLEGVTFTGNTAIREGGGISNESSLEFSIENRCNIYLNNVENRYGGSDICSTEPISVYVDTFTVLYPTSFHAHPIENFTFDVLQGIQNQVETDLYVSPAGDNANSGQSFAEPLKTIQYACSIILASSENPLTIYLAAGTYSPEINNEFFPVVLPPYVSLLGAGRELTILDADHVGSVLKVNNSNDVTVSAMTFTHGMSHHSSGISFLNSSAELSDLRITNCISEGEGGGITLKEGNYDLHNIIISYNSARNGGGIMISCSDIVIMDSLIIENNYADQIGGGICGRANEIHISNSLITNNIAENDGGGVYLYDHTNLYLINVDIIGNQVNEYTAGGIYAGYFAVLDMSDVTIAYNSCSEAGGGLYLSICSQPVFDPINRCNIYLNNFEQRSLGADICSNVPVEIIVDTFTVLSPTDYLAVPIDNFTFDILNSKLPQAAADLYVSPEGDNANSGLTDDEPLKTIQCACSIIQADSLNHRTITLLPGTYSYSSNGEYFPISLPDNVTLTGANQGSVILNAESNSTVVRFYHSINNTIANLKIINGYDDVGGGICCWRSSPYIHNVTLQNNTVPSNYGGAIFIYDDSDPLLVSVKVQYNNAPHGAGIAIMDASATLHNVMIENNSASRKGSGLNCINSDVNLQDVLISENNAQQTGGGIYCENSNLIMSNCLIHDNIAIESGGGIYCKDNSLMQINSSTFYQNSASSGSGIYAGYFSSIYLVNDIFWDNTDEEIYFFGSTLSDTFCLVYSDIQDGADGIIHGNTGIFNITEGNIALNPQFVSIPESDFQLQEDSPCIDTGIDFYEYNDLVLIDLDESEFYGIAPDMGCCEYIADESLPADVPSTLNLTISPNPFNPSTTINFNLPEASHTKLAIYNIKGQLVQMLVDDILPAGNHTSIWNGCDNQNNDLSSGVYLLSLQTDEFVKMQKITLIK
ncbi:MAG: FlgD immunoglobulin-like domain containing protein [Candidatus Stygibacter australis]|nr:FlgD immunoglobulin-like domain containing protein [Candidatus Stygibacter australis]MDP8321551.1 FlgD immunoglobulin-like domain containing protein [Candidatus Stygibacter australis]